MTAPRDTEHWLWRLDAPAWIAAARTELALARQHEGNRRRAVTHARRGAGMALNGVLVAMAGRGWDPKACEVLWGRSYIDHLRRLAKLADAPTEQNPLGRDGAGLSAAIMDVPVVPAGGLVRLRASPGGEVRDVIGHAEALGELCGAFVDPQA